ncbi:hypothetical protein GVN18_39785 [Pseudomonas sp. ODNR1LW]|nr:hypothetical protein [Pseudomonas sp. ODNR1LW]
MANSPSKNGEKTERHRPTGRYATVGRTSDGVMVLQPSKTPNHFTAREARSAVIARIEPADRK